jgi:hypothetical protein
MPRVSSQSLSQLSDSSVSLSFDVSGKMEDAKRLYKVAQQIELSLPPGRYHFSKHGTTLELSPVGNNLKSFKAGDSLGDADYANVVGAVTFDFDAYGFQKLVLHLTALPEDPLKKDPDKVVSADMVPIAHLLPELNRIKKIPAEQRSVQDLRTLSELAAEVQAIFKQIKLDKESEQERLKRVAQEAEEAQRQKEAAAAEERRQKAAAKRSSQSSSSSSGSWSSSPSWRGSG